ncbi:RagB/SusD family nutrient uptake outer membrane protein [Chitinophaga filiformis]|uniref:RagB/SusD family nutrient uptake outer membrane protein n=1 Tax=Chitinophaga filiformis TaxID=104663 RepID=UPI001F3F9A93|nr:RagB/SusD family nutrient uptake outer membrane protein [Chitinophaga filiformis]MCF6402113.1 RagB/SusD family nutrient uptake outer membrane protein [Chitinophaga filiformis]
MKRRKNLFFLLFIYLGTCACKKDFLEVVDNRLLNRQAYVRDLNSMSEFLNGTYGLISENFVYALGEVYPEIAADNLKPLALPPQLMLLHYTWSQQKGEQTGHLDMPTGTNMNGTWQGDYFIIRACNFIIENADKYHAEDPGKADNIKGQAYALRALLYFELVNVFAQTFSFSSDGSHPGVPYITTSDVTQHFTRQSVGDVYKGMISDLKAAIELMPEHVEDIRYMNKYAAKSLLARVYLFRGDYAEARALAEELCQQIPLMTISNGYPNGLFYNRPFLQTEVLFQTAPSDVFETSFTGRFLRGETLYFVATQDIAFILRSDSNDVRSKWVSISGESWNVTKFPVDVAGIRSVGLADYYHPVVRSSEAYLMAAESCAMLKDEDNARSYLNAIRQRANPNVPLLTASGRALIDSIYKERRKELAFEGLRMYDLQRWHKPVIREDALNADRKTLTYPNEKAIAPIPLPDIKLENISQNDGY